MFPFWIVTDQLLSLAYTKGSNFDNFALAQFYEREASQTLPPL
jgi:hypothetical protein